MGPLKGKTIVITGASRGIGEAIALKCAADGANIVVAAKTAEPHPKLPGTVHTVARAVEDAGGKALAVQVDVRDESQVKALFEKTQETFGGIDALINNAGAIRLSNTENTPIKNFDLMMSINVRATYMCSQLALPYLKNADNPHIINLSPPISTHVKWLRDHGPYTISKMGMSMCTIGMAEEFKPFNISVNSLWPKTIIATAAISMLMGKEGLSKCRKPDIVADAAYQILITPSQELTGQTLIDEDFLRDRGVKEFGRYAMTPGTPLMTDLFVSLK